MIVRPFILSASLLTITAISAQESTNPDSLNLVPNGSFEEVDGKLKRLGSIEMAKGWKSPTATNADLFSETVANSPISAPRSQFGDQSALKGTNYAGLRWWSYQNKQPRTYLQAKLKKQLKKGQKYCVRYYVSLSDLSKYSSNELGVFVSKMLVKKDDNMSLTYNAQIPPYAPRSMATSSAGKACAACTKPRAKSSTSSLATSLRTRRRPPARPSGRKGNRVSKHSMRTTSSMT
ncbi:MAG: hypothetical protein IPI55_04050 [Flavobacteriales bacterium]|nr:hypothetical protein [Flavobacteriales bacterium]